MAKKQVRTKEPQTQKFTCKDCRHSRDFHEKDCKGDFFLCKCDFQKRSMFLDNDCCENFVKK